MNAWTGWKRGLAAFLSAVMLFSIVPDGVWAVEIAKAEDEATLSVSDRADLAEEVSSPESAEEGAETAPLEYGEETEAELKSVADGIAEIGYRFSETDPWVRVGADSGSSLPRFDENRNYAIDISAWSTGGEFQRLPVYVIAWDMSGNVLEPKSADSDGVFAFLSYKDENGGGDESKITVNVGMGYTFSAFLPRFESFQCEYGGKSLTFVTDEDWYNGLDGEERKRTACLSPESGYTIELTREDSERPFPIAFSAEEPLTFSNPSDEKYVKINGAAVTFAGQDQSVQVNGCTLTVHDPLYKEVRLTLGEESLTLGEDAEYAKEHKDSYVLMQNNEYAISLGEGEKFPLEVSFVVRGETDYAAALTEAKNADINTDTGVVTFKAQDSSVKAGDYTVTVHDDRAGEVRYELDHVESKTLTKNEEWQKKHEDEYVYLRDGATYPIILSDENTFPVEITFSFPRDLVTKPDFTFSDGTALKNGSADTVLFNKQDASVTVAGYTFVAHSPYVGAVRCETSALSQNPWPRPLIVGTDADEAARSQADADQRTERLRKENPSAAEVKSGYVLFEQDGTYALELNSDETLPRRVTFTEWTTDKGWDTDSAKTFEFNGASSISDEFFGHRFSIHASWLDEVRYRLPGQSTVIVGKDADKSASQTNYELFDENGNFAINPNEGISFPCTVTFTIRNATGSTIQVEETFQSTAKEVDPAAFSGETVRINGHVLDKRDTVTVNGHIFAIRSDWKNEVVYQINDEAKTVGFDTEWAKTHADYDAATKVENPSGADSVQYVYTIKADVRSFPATVKFRMRNVSEDNAVERTFETLDSTVRFGGITFSLHPVWLDAVSYELRNDTTPTGSTVTVTVDQEEAVKAEEEADALTENARKTNPEAKAFQADKLLAEDGKCVIWVEDDAFYPYGIRFTFTRPEKSGKTLVPRNETRTVWFDGPEDQHTVGAYQFSVQSRRTDPAKLISAGVWIDKQADSDGKIIGGQYIPFLKDTDHGVNEGDYDYWADKALGEEYTKDLSDYEAGLQSLLPLRENRLYADLSGYFGHELKNATLEITRATGISGKTDAKDEVAWGQVIADGVSSGTYTIVRNGGIISFEDTSPLYFEMITGQLDQLDKNDMRYIVEVKTSRPYFFNGMLRMNASGADESRRGIRIKENRYRRDGAEYTDSRTSQKTEIGSYTFDVNEQWKDGPVYLTMWPNEDSVNYTPFKKLTASVHEGVYTSVAAFLTAKEKGPVADITEMVWKQELDMQPAARRYSTNLTKNKDSAPFFTVVWYRDGVPVAVMPFRVYVNIVPDAQWVDDLEDGIPTNRIMRDWPDDNDLLLPHTNNTTIQNESGGYDQWSFTSADRFEPEEAEPYEDITVYHYRVPNLESFKGLAMDRFYVSVGYWHHTRKGSKNAAGEEVEEAFDEPEGGESPYDVNDTGRAAWQKYGISVYAGQKPYETLNEAQESEEALNVSAQIFSAAGFGAEFGKTIYFSFFDGEGVRFECRGVQIQSETRVTYKDMVLNGDNFFAPSRINRYKEEETETITFRMPAESYPIDGMYSVQISYQTDFKDVDWRADGSVILVSDEDCSALSLSEARKKGMDVTALALKAPGYSANYSGGVHFHVYNGSGELISHRKVITESYQAPAASEDTWFRIQGAARSSGVTDRYVGYKMPYTADAYYQNGYQTIFLMDRKRDEDGHLELDDEGSPIYIPIEDGREFYPLFEKGQGWDAEKITIYSMHDEGGEIQRSGENKYTFNDHRQVIEYSAAAANGRHLRNYWVTFLTQMPGGPALFVNTANDSTHWQTLRDSAGNVLYEDAQKTKPRYVQDAAGNPYPEREVFITDPEGGHDIFFANIGDEPMENLQVRLDSEDVIRLDDYWHDKGSSKRLDAYTTIQRKDVDGEDVSYGGIPNIAKIRIFAVNPAEAASIDTYLTISADGVSPVKIHLTGSVGGIRIDSPTETYLRPAVKYVPYANLIHTNNLYGGDTVAFSISGTAPAGVANGASDEQGRAHYYGRLPQGMELRPNGELYGAPKEIGLFTFTVTASFSYNSLKSSDSREYTLEVKENTEYNVWMENDWTRDGFHQENVDDGGGQRDEFDDRFGVERWIPDINVTSTTAQFDHTHPYAADISQPGTEQLIEGNTEGSDERRARHADKTYTHSDDTDKEDGKWSKYRDVVFEVKNYNDEYQNGEGDFEWFVGLWINGERLNGIRLDVDKAGMSDEEYLQALTDKFNETPELRSVYQFYYGNGSYLGVGTGETWEAYANEDVTVSYEGRVGKDTNSPQRTAAQKVKVTGPKSSKPDPDPKPNPQPDPPTPTPKPGNNSGGGGSSVSGSTRKTYYTITVNNPAAGGYLEVTPGTGSSEAGKTVTIVAHLEEGFTLSKPTVTRKNGRSVTVSRSTGKTNTWTFKMPASDVTISGAVTGNPRYSIGVTQPETGGYLTVDPAGPVVAGTAVTITAHLESAYELVSLPTVTGGVSVTAVSETSWRFRMPASNVTVSAELQVIRLNGFTDIDATMWFFADAKWAYERVGADKVRLMQGVTPELWQPKTRISSITAAITLRRLANADLTPYFTGEDDGLISSGISANNAAAIRWAWTNHILPRNIPVNSTDRLRRGDFALILCNFLKSRGIVITPSDDITFSDAWRMSQEELESFRILYEAGIFNGDSTNAMLPQNSMSRAHLAALLHRLSAFIIKKEEEMWGPASGEESAET